MISKEKEGVHWLEFELFAEFPRVKHALFLRKGGESQGIYSSFNLSSDIGDNADAVAANMTKARKLLQLPHIVISRNLHGKTVERIDSYSDSRPACDGLATRAPGLGLMVHHADCQAALFYDPVQHALAAVHCGWRGNVQNIYAEAVAFMQREFHSKPENLFVGISPSLGPSHAEFIHYKTELPEAFHAFQVKPLYFDLWAISEMQLQACGVLPHHIQIARLCTYADPENFYSYRRDKMRGGHGSVAALV